MSECMWNTTPRAGGCIRPLPKSSVDCNNLLKRYAYPGNGFIPESYAEPDSWLARACAALYGKKAGKWMHDYQLLRSKNGLFPLSILYYETSMRRKIFRIIDNPATDYAKEADYWEEKQRITIDGLALINKAINCLEMTSDEIMRGLLDELLHQRHRSRAFDRATDLPLEGDFASRKKVNNLSIVLTKCAEQIARL